MSEQANSPLKYWDVVQRVRNFHEKYASEQEAASKEAGATKVPEQDPREVGTRDIPKDPHASTEKQNLPAQQKNDQSNEGTKLEDQDTHPTSTGKNVPATRDGNSREDAFNSPTTPLNKIASRAAALRQRLTQPSAGEAKEASNKAPEGDGSTQRPQVNASDAKAASNCDPSSDIPNPEVLLKLASTILETQGGIEAVEPVLRKAAGLEAARDLIGEASFAHEQFIKLAQEQLEEEQMYIAEQARVANELRELTKSASARDIALIEKIASTHTSVCNNIDDPLLKQAYMQGGADAAAMADGEELPGAGGPESPEEILEMLEAAVASGEISEEEAAMLLEELLGGGEGGGGEEAMAAAMGGGGGGEEEAMAAAMGGGGEAMPEEAKMASALADRLLA